MPELGQINRLWAVRTLEFVTALQTVHTHNDVLDLFRREIAQVGFHSYVMVVMDDREFSQRVIANGWSPQWAAIYANQEIREADPVRRKLLCSANPFSWSEASYDPRQEPQAELVMRLASDFQMNEGFCVPIRCGEAMVMISIAGDKPELDPCIRPALHIMALFAYNQFHTLAKAPYFRSPHVLTKREREVLQWVSAGKSDWDISAILHISERTARAHVTNAARKLNAANRPAAIAEALRAGEISLNH